MRSLFADVLRANVRGGDLVGRFGGEEFCIYLPGASADVARSVAERMRAAVAATPMPDADAPPRFVCESGGCSRGAVADESVGQAVATASTARTGSTSRPPSRSGAVTVS